MLKFKIFAGTMHCGFLAVWPNEAHSFLTRDNKVLQGRGLVSRVAAYKNLTLIRV